MGFPNIARPLDARPLQKESLYSLFHPRSLCHCVRLKKLLGWIGLLLSLWIIGTGWGIAAPGNRLTVQCEAKPVAWEASAGILRLLINSDGSYSIRIEGKEWLRSGQTALHTGGKWYSSQAGPGQLPLKLVGGEPVEGSDALGDYHGFRQVWDAQGTPFRTVFRLYQREPALVFEQQFPEGAATTSVGHAASDEGASEELKKKLRTSYGYDYREVMSSFPSFKSQSELKHLNYLTYRGHHSPARRGVGLQGFQGGLDGGVPLALFDRSLKTVILSPLSNFQVGIQTLSEALGGDLSCGIEGLVESIPKGFTHPTLLYAGQGINHSFDRWGWTLLQYYGKDRSGPGNDFTVRNLGYWTDNGAYYYYHTEPYKNYQDTLLDVRSTHQREGIPFRYYQLDSWWYYKGPEGGVKLWQPRKDVFPSGLLALHQDLGTPLVMHNRWWSPSTDYARQFNFIVEKSRALPDDPAFWDYLMGQAKSEGDLVYEQDWLIDQFNRTQALHRDVSMARQWLVSMGKAAQDHNMTIQYCMALPGDFLQTAEIPAVTQIRVSDDYHPGNGQWRVGATSMLAWALGLAAFKDTFWSNDQEVGSPYRSHEPNYQLQTLVSALTAGPVGPGDGIGHANKDLLMKTCRADGLLLKPDKPATPVDRSLLPGGPGGELWDTFSQHNGKQWHYVIAIGLRKEFNLLPSDLYLSGHAIAYNYYTGTASILDRRNPLKLVSESSGKGAVPFSYYMIAPLQVNGWALLGEMDKFIPLSRQRFSRVSEDGMEVTVEGNVGEKVSLSWIAPAAPSIVEVNGARIPASSAQDLPAWRYDPSKRLLTVILLIPDGKSVKVRVEPQAAKRISSSKGSMRSTSQ